MNLIRVWRLKKRGEYICPRCKGISNIYHSPLIYALALLCCAAGFLIVFAENYISRTSDLNTVVKVFIPFAVFYFFSLFMVYLEKPIIKKVFRREDGKMVDEKGEVVHIAVNTILSSGGKRVKNKVKNPANAEYPDLKNDPLRFKDSQELIRKIKPKEVPEEVKKAKVSNPAPATKEVKKEAETVKNEKASDKTVVMNTIKAEEKKETNEIKETKEVRNETKYTKEELNKLEKASDKVFRDSGTQTIRSRYKNESEFDEIFAGTQEISDRRLKSAKIKGYDSSVATPEIKKEK